MKHTIKCRIGDFPTANLRNIIIPESPLKRKIKPGDTLSFVSSTSTVNCMVCEAPSDRCHCYECFIYHNVANTIHCFAKCNYNCVVISMDDVLEKL